MDNNHAVKGDWVRLHIVAMTPAERAAHLPADTKEVPLEMWVKGFLQEERANIGDHVHVITRTGRSAEGTFVELNPSYTHSFGTTVPELLQVGPKVRQILFGGEC